MSLKAILPALLIAAGVPRLASGTAVCSELGDTTVASQGLGGLDGLLLWKQVQVPAGLALQAVNVYLGSGVGQWRAALYSDRSSSPYRLLAEAPPATVSPNAWNRAELPSGELAAGAYWLGLQVNSPQVSGRYEDQGGRVAFAVKPYGSFPQAAPGVSIDTYLVSAYGEFCVPPPTLTSTPTPSATPSPTISPTFTVSPTWTPSPTVSPTFTISPTWTLAPPAGTLRSPGPAVLVGPVPAKVGEPLCLAFGAEPLGGAVTLYNSAGQQVARLVLGAGAPSCFETHGWAAGVYYLAGTVEGQLGAAELRLKAVLLP